MAYGCNYGFFGPYVVAGAKAGRGSYVASQFVYKPLAGAATLLSATALVAYWSYQDYARGRRYNTTRMYAQIVGPPTLLATAATGTLFPGLRYIANGFSS